jgi:flagellar motor switch protein FliG
MTTTTDNMHDAGLRKAAVLVASLDGPAADVLLAQLGPDRAQLVRQAVMDLDEIDPQEQHRVIDEFRRIGSMLPQQCPPGIDLDGLSAAAAIPAGRGDRAEQDDGLAPAEQDGAQPFEFLSETEEEELAELLHGERPQTIALVLSHLTAERAGDVLSRLEPSLQVEVVRRWVDLDGSDPEILREIGRALESRLSQQFAAGAERATGPEAVSQILAACDRQIAGDILQNLAKFDRPLAEQLGGPPPQFDDLAQLDDETLLAVVRATAPEVVQAALLGAAPELIDRLLGRMTLQEAANLRHGLNHPGPVRLSDIEEARRQMAESAGRRWSPEMQRPLIAA